MSNTLLSVKGYMDTHPLVPPIAEATAQMAIVTGSIASIENLGGTQTHGEGEALGATDSRELIALELRAAVREISGIAKQLDQTLYPGAKATFRLTGTGSYTGLLKNTIDWVSSPVKGDPEWGDGLKPFEGKVVGLLSASPGGLGGLRSLSHLSPLLLNLQCWLTPRQFALARAGEVFDAGGQLAETARLGVKGVVDQALWAAQRLAS